MRLTGEMAMGYRELLKINSPHKAQLNEWSSSEMSTVVVTRKTSEVHNSWLRNITFMLTVSMQNLHVLMT